MKHLTEKQKVFLNYIISFVEDAGYPPTYREMGLAFGIALQAVTDNLFYIEKKGYIARDGYADARAIAVLANAKGEPVKLRFCVEK